MPIQLKPGHGREAPANERDMQISYQQEAITAWFKKDQKFFDDSEYSIDVEGHLIVRARAGTGKSFTIRLGVKQAPERNWLVAAFSKDIQLEMERLIAPFPNGKVQTLHSVGLGCIRKFRSNLKVEFGSYRADSLASAVCGNSCPDAIIRLVSKLHTKGREIVPHASRPGDLLDIAIKFDCEPEDSWARSGYPLEKVEEYALAAMVLASSIKSGETIDGSDMIFLPVRNRWLVPMFDGGVIDEGQDMTPAQLEVARGVVKPGGRICVVGDDRQAIFGFRGADSDCLDRLKHELNAGELGLTKTYRCGKIIVERAQTFVPDIEADENNPEGEILYINDKELITAAGPDDFILSRVNAPITGVAMKLFRAGKRTQILGKKDLGRGLIDLIRKLRAKDVEDFVTKVEQWCQREQARLQARHDNAIERRRGTILTKMEDNLDKADTLIALAEGQPNVEAIIKQIDDLFSDASGVGMITCSSIHRAKGKEASRVFVLQDTLRDYNLEEQNLQYVAITRAKHTLVFVSKSIKEDK